MISGEGTGPGDKEEVMPLNRLQSEDHEEVLNVIDQLRSEGIGTVVDLPQLIVCGDQSSGKSSVLEAISGLNFPRRDGICTRFATELILRRAPESKINVSINPDRERPEKEQSRLRKFQPKNIDLAQFDKIVEDAGNIMQVGEDDRQFSKDILRVEVSGPKQPHLTLVDLPGLYHAPDEQQDMSGIARVEYLVRSYIKNPRSVMLAVISAKSELPLQMITRFTREVDPDGTRTLGVITKPDTLPKNSDEERSFRLLAENKKVVFTLGWHILKNRSHEERNHTLAERNESEAEFLSQGTWGSLPRKQTGIQTLIPRLSTILKDHILSQIPDLIKDTYSSFRETKLSLEKLGASRQTLSEQRRYLLQGSERFALLVNSSLDGSYSDPFFGNTSDDDFFPTRLRAVVRDRLLHFAEAMNDRGEYVKIIDEGLDHDNQRRCMYRTEYVELVRKRLRWSRGRELPGSFNPMMVGELFYQQARPWEMIVDEFINYLLHDVRSAIILMLSQVLDQHSVKGLIKQTVDERLSELEGNLRTKTTELLRPQQSGHPITNNHLYTRIIQETRDRHLRESITEKLKAHFGAAYPTNPYVDQSIHFRMQGLIDSLTSDTETDMERFACTEALDSMMAYYQVAMTQFVDAFSNLAVEKCLLEPLPHVFSPSVVETMTDKVVEDIACEDKETASERRRLNDKLYLLGKCLSHLQQLDKYNLAVPHVSYMDNHGDKIQEQAESTEDERNRSELSIEEILPADEEFQGEILPELDIVTSETFDDLSASTTRRPLKKKKHREASRWEES